MKRTASALLSLACLLLASGWATAQEKQPPDVLFIAVDDLNDWTGHLGGHPQAKTPNMDRLIARGMTFTNAHCAAPACNPSRTALMSGVRPYDSGIYLNSHPASGFLRHAPTINRLFKDSGYHVVGGGKIYHGHASEGRDDTWTHWQGLFGSAGHGDHNFNGLGKGHFDWGPIPAKTEEMGDAKLTDWAIEQLRSAPADQPLFLAVGYVKPHLPWYVPQEYFDRFPLEDILLPEVNEHDLYDVPPGGKKMANAAGDHAAVIKNDQWAKGVQAYLATISFLDDQVGRLCDAIEKSPRGEDMIVVWWTDHGWHLGEKQHWRKFALWNDATHTSFGIAAPGITSAGQQCDAPVDYTSVMPTLCELTGVNKPEQATAPSLLPLLKNADATWEHVAICTHGRGNHAVIDDQYRLIRYEDGGEELYDYRADPNEWDNLAGREDLAAVLTRLRQYLPAEEAAPPAEGEGQNRPRRKNRGQQTQ